jgi:hypothetical protein
VLAVLTLLALAGVVWLIIKPGPIDVGRVLTASFLGLLAVGFIIGAGYYWLRLQRRISPQPGGLEYFDGRQSHKISWDDVREIYEVVTSVKMLGITVDSPALGVALVTQSGVRCEIDKNIQGWQTLGPIVSREVNQNLSRRVREQLKRRERVQFGPVGLSLTGIVIQQPTPVPWWETLKQKIDNQPQSRVVVPGEYSWKDVGAIQIAPAMHGDKWADHTTYNQLEIWGPQAPVYVCPIPVFPNFAVFTEILEALKRPLGKREVT